MSKINIGIDYASGSDYTVVTIFKRRYIHWYQRLAKRFHLIKHLWEFKILDSYNAHQPTKDNAKGEKGEL